MSFNNTTLNPSSIFTYKDAVNFINSINIKCNSDKDCPYDSICLSNKCIVSFYCDDNDKCSFYKTLCDGKPCKKDLTCNSGSDCLSGLCYEMGNEKKCIGYHDYTSGTFTFNDAYNYYKNLNKCETDIDCPHQSDCIDKECVTDFYCKENDDNFCAFDENTKDGMYYNNLRNCKVNEDCVSGICTNGRCERTNYALVSRNSKLFGLEVGEKCTKDSQCYSDYCQDNGTCGNIQNLSAVGYIFIGFIALVVIVALALAYYIFKNCCGSSKNKKSKNISQV
eukprot:jgi/Orpsp1_1/1185230/evm.model.c7180000092857.1